MNNVIKKIILIIFFTGISHNVLATPPTSSVSRIYIDGISENSSVVITKRNPVFSWDFSYSPNREQRTVEILISTVLGDSDIWNFEEILMVNYKVYDGAVSLAANTLYHLAVRIRDDEGLCSDWILTTFPTINAGVVLSASRSADLEIDLKNPFNPTKGEVSRIRYQILDSNEYTIIRIYTITGELVKTLVEHIAQQKALYSVDWDGKNAEGNIVASGVDLVNMQAGTAIRETKRIVVIK